MPGPQPISFEHPPIAEVSFGVSFLELAAFTTAHVGKYWSTIEADFPLTQDQPPAENLREVFPGDDGETQLQLSAIPPLRRTWFFSSDRSRLIQVQADRFIFNSRRGTGPYSRYQSTRPQFDSWWTSFNEFIERQTDEAPSLTQFELAYVNHIPLAGPFSNLQELGRVFKGFAVNSPGPVLGLPEIQRWRASFPMPDRKGRLHVDVGTGNLKGSPGVRMTLLARGFHKGGFAEWFDLAHELIVKGFAELTTAEMHQHWGRHE